MLGFFWPLHLERIKRLSPFGLMWPIDRPMLESKRPKRAVGTPNETMALSRAESRQMSSAGSLEQVSWRLECVANDVRRPAYLLGAVLRILYASHLNSEHATCSRFKTAGLSPLGISDKATPAPLKKHLESQQSRFWIGSDPCCGFSHGYVNVDSL